MRALIDIKLELGFEKIKKGLRYEDDKLKIRKKKVFMKALEKDIKINKVNILSIF